MTALSELRKINKNDEREKNVVKTSVIGVVTNILLAVFKMDCSRILLRSC